MMEKKYVVLLILLLSVFIWVAFLGTNKTGYMKTECTLCLKNDIALACYNFDEHRIILIIFGRNVAKKVNSQMLLYFPTLPY